MGLRVRTIIIVSWSLKSQNPKIGGGKVENLVDSSIVGGLDDGGFFEKLRAE